MAALSAEDNIQNAVYAVCQQSALGWESNSRPAGEPHFQETGHQFMGRDAADFGFVGAKAACQQRTSLLREHVHFRPIVSRQKTREVERLDKA
jgi:hypothetical protein